MMLGCVDIDAVPRAPLRPVGIVAAGDARAAAIPNMAATRATNRPRIAPHLLRLVERDQYWPPSRYCTLRDSCVSEPDRGSCEGSVALAGGHQQPVRDDVGKPRADVPTQLI